MNALRFLGIVPPVVVSGWLLYGLWQLGHFQKQERVWRQALGQARVLAIVNVGLAPFLFWWNRLPGEPFYVAAVLLMGLTGLLFLGSLNVVLQRLTAMLPDEMLRLETRHFTTFNQILLLTTLALAAIFFLLGRLPSLPPALVIVLDTFQKSSLWLLVVFVLLPVAMTMALLWKTKEVVLDSVFGAQS
jgi:hypothetical protein